MAITEKIEAMSDHHEHELELVNHRKPYKCDGCKTDGFGSRYRCEKCNFDLHPDCMFTTHSAASYHHFFPRSTFHFFSKPPKHCKNRHCHGGDGGEDGYCDDCQRYCDGCGKAVNGFVYHCSEEGWDLHPRCMELEKRLSNIDGVEFRLRDEVAGQCAWCEKRKLHGSFSGIRGWSYVSDCGEYRFHVHCAAEMVLEGWRKNKKIDCDDRDCLALEEKKLPGVVAKRSGGRGRGSKFWRVVRVFLKTIACVLLGDPTITLTCLLVELIA